jgi:hypothetical protein
MKGRDEEALETLKKLHAGVLGHDDEFYLKEFHQIKAQYEIEKDEKLGIVAIFKRPSYRKRMYLIITFAAFGQFTGRHTVFSTFRALPTLADLPFLL